MRRAKSWLALIAVLAALTAGLVAIFDLRLASGDVYPPYSSLRADALGTRGLHYALASLPGHEVRRDFQPLDRLESGPQLVLIAGADWTDWQSQPAAVLSALNRAAISGARIVLAFRADEVASHPPPAEEETGGNPAADDDRKSTDEDAKSGSGKGDLKKSAPAKPGEKKTEKEKPEKTKGAAKPKHPEWEHVKIADKWGVEIRERWLFSPRRSAERSDAAGPDLPATLPWRSDIHFIPAKGVDWKVLYRRGNQPVVIERRMGAGSLVLMANAFCLSNEALQRERATSFLLWLISGQRRIVFAESELGVVDENGVGALARRYGLGGALALCALLGALYAWRLLAPFVPRPRAENDDELQAGHEPAAGFTALLRRSMGAEALLPACVEEWKRARLNPGGNAAVRFDAAWRVRPAGQPPGETYNALADALRKR
ncbi:MAG TPA: hypothetical protein VGM73_07070 [Candidatus Didemnitutus sp.]|jgi:hypothetical protein